MMRGGHILRIEDGIWRRQKGRGGSRRLVRRGGESGHRDTEREERWEKVRDSRHNKW